MTIDIGNGLVTLGMVYGLGWLVGKWIDYHLTLAVLECQQTQTARDTEEEEDARY